jgi:superfamily II DNA or RNA helicase
MLYANSKSRIKVLQSIGRGLRKHVSKNKVIIYDIIDDLSYKTRTGKAYKNYCMQHYDERLSYYTEQEFPVVETTINL